MKVKIVKCIFLILSTATTAAFILGTDHLFIHTTIIIIIMIIRHLFKVGYKRNS